MPILDWNQANAGVPSLPQTVVPTPPQEQQSPGALDLASAALRRTNVVSSLYDRMVNNPDSTAPAQPGYDPYASNGIAGYENFADRFSRSTSPEQTQVIKNRIDGENADKQTIARSGWSGVAASLASGVVDPLTIASMAVAPETTGPRLLRIGQLALANVAVGEAQAGVLSSNSETTKYTDNMGLRIGANALLAGVFGAYATRVPKPEFDALAAKTASNLAEQPISSTAGAAQVMGTSLHDESIAKGGQGIAATAGQVSPITRIMQNSPVVESRQLAQQLVDVPYLLNKNVEQGIATPSSIESRVTQAEGSRNFQMVQNLDRQFADYKKGGGDLSHADFSEAVADAMRSGDQHEIPQVQAIAQQTRKIFSADRAALAEHGAMPEGTEVLGAPSYFPRVYDQPAIMAGRTDLENRLTQWFTDHPKIGEDGLPIQREAAEVKDAVYTTLDKIQGTVRGTADIGQGMKNPSVLKARALDVPDAILKPYLSSDYEHVMESYNRAVLPQIEMRRAFGSTDLAREFQTVTDAYHAKINYAVDDAEKAKLIKQQSADMGNLTLLRDRVLNQTGPRGNESLNMVRAAQLVRSFNYLRMLGGQTLSAIPDVGRLVARYGLINTGARMSRLLSGLSGGLMKADAQRMGTALDVVLHTRMKTLDGIGDELAGSQLGRRMQNATAAFTKVTLIASWDAMMRTLSSQLEQDALKRLVDKVKVSALERGKLASHGIGVDELPAIREQWAKYGSSENGLNRARTELWDDKDAASKVEQAVVRAGQSNAFAIGKGDLPGFASSELGKIMLQFKAFALSSVNRLAIPLSQGIAHGDIKAANGLASMLALGGLTYTMKELAAGRKPDFSPHNLIPEAVQRSGVLTFLPDMYDPVAGALHLPRFSKFQDLDPLETLGGPTAGTLASLMGTVKGLTDGQVTAGDLHKLRQLLPYQNLFYFRRLIDMLEGKAADAIGAKNATGMPVADYFKPSQFETPSEKPDKKHLFGQDAIPNHF
jgi:hypothetical protein